MDKKRILSKIDEMNKYLEELGEIKPLDYEEYESSTEKRRACERLLQIAIESLLDICNILISELKLGIPSNEDEVFDKLENKKIISKQLSKTLKEMKGFRNILVHKYGIIENERVFEMLSDNLDDFEKFKEEILKFIKNSK